MANGHPVAKNRDMSEQSTSGPQTGMDKIFDTLRGIGIRRRTDDGWIAGVSSGLADRMAIDPVIVRAGFVLLSLLGGVGITIYLLAWALIPNDRDEIVAQRALRDGDGGSIVLIVIAALSLFGGSAFGGSWLGGHSVWGFPWGVVITGLLIWWLVRRSGSHPDHGQPVRTQQLATPPARPSWGSATAGVAPSKAEPPTQALPLDKGLPHVEAAPGSQATGGTQGWQERPGERRVVPGRARRRSGGPLMALLAIGLAIATFGSVLWAGNAFSWSGDHATIAIAGSLASVGLLSVVLGVVGWRAGFVAFLAVVLALTAGTSAMVPAGMHVNGRVGSSTWTPTSVTAPAGDPYQLGVGDGVLDLRALPPQSLASAANPITIPAYVGLGDLKVLVPPGLRVLVAGHVGLGAIVLPNDTDGRMQGGSDVSRSAQFGTGTPQVVVNAGVGIGQLTVVKE